MTISQRLTKAFNKSFNREPLLVRAPGRINLIGEHTDYNHGLVMPGAIDRAACFAVARNDGNICHIHGMDVNDSITVDLTLPLETVIPSWAKYLLGVLTIMLRGGADIKGFDLMFSSDIPIGSGLSSSAALECGMGYALNALFGLGYSGEDLAYIGQQAEQQFVGVQCGIMDQFACCFGKKNNLIMLDCDAVKWHYVPVKLDSATIILIDSMVRHELAESEYNNRRQQCDQAVSVIRRQFPEVRTLRNVSKEMITACADQLSEIELKRSRFVVEENDRVCEAEKKLNQGDLDGVGELINQSHLGLSQLYEVSCTELDFLVEAARGIPGVYGSRMMGGGFGGCTLNIVDSGEVEDIVNQISESYEKKFSTLPNAYTVSLEPGISKLN